MADSRVKRVVITREMMSVLFRGHIGIVAGLPDDAKCTSIHHNVKRQTIEAMIESSEFEPIPEGEVVPVVDATTIEINYDDQRQ